MTPPPSATDRPPGRTTAAQLASFAVESSASAIPPEVRDRAKLHFLDTFGCGVAAVGLGAGAAATTAAMDQGGKPESSVLGESTLAPAPLAALANGTRCHALDFDDTHEGGICHSSTVVAPAALATGEALGCSGEEVLDAYVFGSEVALRIAIATAERLYERGFHPTSVCASFGATAAVCRLLGLGVDGATNALGIVGSFAGGLLEYLSDGSATKPLHAGWAAQAGIQAARLAAAGGTGPASVIEGRFGVMASHTGSASGSDAICDGLGVSWETANVSIKPFPACHFAHSSTWAAGALADKHGLDHPDVAEIYVSIPDEGVPLVLDPPTAKVEPKSPYDAKFSLPFTVAHRLVHGHLDLASFSPRSIRDPEVLAVASRVRSEPLAEPSPSRFAGGARLVTHSGDQFTEFIAHAPGSPQNRLDERWILSKFRSNSESALGSDETDELIEALRTVDEGNGIDRATALMRTCNVRAPAAG